MSAGGGQGHRDFLLTEGGLSHRLEMRAGLIRAGAPRTDRRALFSILTTWVPLLVLSALQSRAIGQTVAVPFLHDFAVHARFLLAVPLMLVSEIFIGERLACAAKHFIDSGLIAEKDFERFNFAIDRGLQWRDSTIAEVVLGVLAYTVTAAGLLSSGVRVSIWYTSATASGHTLSWAGWWFVVFCVPLFQFLSLRWLWRLFLWAQFLWRMNNLDLQLVPTHPDESGGLAFVGKTQRFFGSVLLAYSIAVAGVIANGVIYDKFPLPHFAAAIAVYVFIAVSIVLLPLLIFTTTLLQTKRVGLYQYATLATEYTSSFHQKWIVGPRQVDEILLGTGDIQSLADLANSFSVVQKMDTVPMEPKTPIHLVLACLLPMAPLLLTMMPLDQIVKMLLKVVL